MATEINSFTVREPLYYHREYENDVANWQRREVLAADIDEPEALEPVSWSNTFARGAVAVLPFISLYKPSSFPLSLGLNGLRTWSSLSKLDASMVNGQINPQTYPCIVQTGVAVIALASTVFAHPLGILVTTGHDLLAEVVRFARLRQEERYDKTLESLLKIANHTLYFGLFIVGGLELTFASLAFQILLCLYQSHGEYRDGKYIEAVGHFAMACVRSSQLYDQAQALRLKWEIDELLASIRASAAR
ncbi:MAG: hypothetical protein ACHQT8_06650 [Chlamydiales bacterium]